MPRTVMGRIAPQVVKWCAQGLPLRSRRNERSTPAEWCMRGCAKPGAPNKW